MEGRRKGTAISACSANRCRAQAAAADPLVLLADLALDPCLLFELIYDPGQLILQAMHLLKLEVSEAAGSLTSAHHFQAMLTLRSPHPPFPPDCWPYSPTATSDLSPHAEAAAFHRLPPPHSHGVPAKPCNKSFISCRPWWPTSQLQALIDSVHSFPLIKNN